MFELISDSTSIKNLAASASKENQPELRNINKYEPLLPNLSPARKGKRISSFESWFESTSKQMRIGSGFPDKIQT